VQIFEAEDERPLGRESFDRFSHLAQHPLVRRLLHLTLESLKIICFEQGRQLYQPRRRILAEYFDQLFPLCISAEPSQGF
jgi:hypothetical protein